MHYRRLLGKLSEKDKNNETFKKIGKKIENRMRSLGNIEPIVNVPVNRKKKKKK